MLNNQNHTKEEKIYIDNIPVIRFYPSKLAGEKYKTIIFYHGWSSTKELQRMRGYILASFGYQVLIPEAIYHGERGIINYEDLETSKDKFWSVVIKNIEEVDILKDYIVKKLSGDINKIAVAGNSMGGITSSGILLKDKDIKVGAILNGSCNWGLTNDIFKEQFKIKEDKIYNKIIEKTKNLDPSKNLDKLIGKDILILHGQDDSLVSIKAQEDFYEKVDKENNNILFIAYNNLNHLVTTNMMEEMVIWFDNHL